MSIETSIAAGIREPAGQPYPYSRVELTEPDWTRFPGWRDVTAEDWASVQWQRAHCVKNIKQLRELLGDLVDERFYADLERDQTERATMSMLVPPQMLNTMVPHVAALRPRIADRRVLRRPDPSLHAARLLRPAHGLAVAPARHPRLAPRARHVGGRGSHPPLPDQGARRAAADLPAVLRSLHPDGPGRQLHADRREAQVRREAERPAHRHARLPAPYAVGPRRRRVRRRRRQHAVAAPRGVPRLAARDRQHPRHPARDQGPDRPAAALGAARRRRGRPPRRHDRSPPWRLPGDPHPRQPRPVGDAGGRRRHHASCSTPASATSATRASSSTASTPTRTRSSTCASRSSTARGSCPTTSTCAT